MILNHFQCLQGNLSHFYTLAVNNNRKNETVFSAKMEVKKNTMV